MTSQTISRQFEELDPGVLVVCGDEGERLQICDLLETGGFLARGVETGAEAEVALRLEDADLIILDGRLRDGGAMAVCRRLAVLYAAPIIMISESADVTDRVIALEVGADDLLSRPFNSRELLARARALVRRSRALLNARILGMDGGRQRVRGAQSWRIDAITRKLTAPQATPRCCRRAKWLCSTYFWLGPAWSPEFRLRRYVGFGDSPSYGPFRARLPRLIRGLRTCLPPIRHAYKIMQWTLGTAHPVAAN